MTVLRFSTAFVNQSINQSVNFYSGLSDRSHFEDH